MEISYGVVWQAGSSRPVPGKLELRPSGLHFEGREASQDIPYDHVASVRVGRSAADRIGGRPSVVLEQRSGDPVTIATVAQSHLIGEIVERLAAGQSEAERTGNGSVSYLPTPGPGDSEGGDVF